jgi:hypothetical protein
MNINVAIIDQRLTSVMEDIRDKASQELNLRNDETKLKSLAFVYLTVKTLLDLTPEETFDCLTEGGGDFGIDAIHISDEVDNEFTVTLFQGKYSKDKLEGNANFSENAIKQMIHAIRYLFDPTASLKNVNRRLQIKVEETRALIRDGYIPQVRAIACNNGLTWNKSAEQEIKRAFKSQVEFEHCNHDRLLSILQAPKQIRETLQFSGKAIVEDFNFSRVFVGRIAVSEISAMIDRHGERLLERNIRRYLGLEGNRVNERIRATLHSDKDRTNFYFYNNGITLICDKFNYNGLQQGDYQVNIENLQIINGGQTCMTIFKTEHDSLPVTPRAEAFVLVRLYELSGDNEDLVQQITFATNSQNPVDWKDLRANDDLQRRLEIDINQLGFSYRRKRSDSALKNNEITTGTTAAAILSVWRRKPHQAKFLTREHFGKLYSDIFTTDLNGTQVVTAVLLYRIAENYRRRPPEDAALFIPYASCFIAMQMGKYLLAELKCNLAGLTHLQFATAKSLIEQKEDAFFKQAADDIAKALEALYGKRELSAQQLSATFRRGDLISILEKPGYFSSWRSDPRVRNNRKRKKGSKSNGHAS